MLLDFAESSTIKNSKEKLPPMMFSFGGGPAPAAMVKDVMSKFPGALMYVFELH